MKIAYLSVWMILSYFVIKMKHMKEKLKETFEILNGKNVKTFDKISLENF